MWAKYGQLASVMDTPFERLLVLMKDPLNKEVTEDFISDLRASVDASVEQSLTIYSYLDSFKSIEKINSILNIIFNVIIAITMFLCFFSLSSAMSANLYEQSKEIGVMRAIGLRKTRIYLLYLYEAFVLVLSSSLLGVCIGIMVGFSTTIQRALFLDLPLNFFFPWQQFLIIMGISLLCAFLSTFGPTRDLMKMEVSAIFRLN